MIRDRLREIEWKSVLIIAVPLLIVTLLIAFLLLRDDSVSSDTLRRAQYSESAQNVTVSKVSSSQKVGEYALVSADVMVKEAPDPNDVTIDYDEEGAVTPEEKLGEDDSETTIDPLVDGEPVPEGEEADDPEANPEGPVAEVDSGRDQLTGEPLTREHFIGEGSDLYTVNFYPADEFLVSGRFASEKEADFSIDALEALIEEASPAELEQIGFIEGVGHTGAYVSSTYIEGDADGENHLAFFRAYITDGDIVAVIEGSTEGGSNGYRPDFIREFNLVSP